MENKRSLCIAGVKRLDLKTCSSLKLKGKLQSFSRSNTSQQDFQDAYNFCLSLFASLLESGLFILLLKFAFSFMVDENS